jgi:hypothetical protein
VEVEVKRSDRRRRLIPFSAMMGIGLIATLVWLSSQSNELFKKPRPGTPTWSAGAMAATANSSQTDERGKP